MPSMCCRWLVVAAIVLAVSPWGHAQNKKRPPAYRATIVGAEAYYFTKPNLDAEVITILPEGAKVLASTKIYGEFAKFRRVKFQGKMGYVTTIDVSRPDGSRPKAASAAPQPDPVEDFSSEDRLFGEPEFPSIFRNGAGPVVSYMPSRVNLIAPRTKEMWAVGAKLAGPDWFWKGPIADFQVAVAFPPSWDPVIRDLKAYSVLVDYGLAFPFFLRQKFNFTVRLGPSVIYNSVDSAHLGMRLRRWDLGMIAAPTLSYTYKSLRLDAGAKYHWNGAPFWSYFLSLEYLLKANSPH